MTTNQEMRDWNRKASFIERNVELYQIDPTFKRIVDDTIYLTEDEVHNAQKAVVTKFGTQWAEFERLRWAGDRIPNA